MNAQRIKLNLVPGGISPIVHVSQYDVGRVLEFVLYDGVTAASIESGTSIDIRGTKPDNTGFCYPCTFSRNVASIATKEQMTAVSGSFDCELHISKGTQDFGTANFILEVEPAALNENTSVSETEIPSIIDAARTNRMAAEQAASAAATSEANAANSASAAATSEANAANSASTAATSEANALGYARSAMSESSLAQEYSAAARTNRMAAEKAASAAATSEANAANSKSDSEAYAMGTRNGVDVGSDDITFNNNAKHYADVAQAAAVGGLIPQGTCPFANLPNIETAPVGAMWNISDDFITTADFREGANVPYGAGSNVYKTVDGKWDVTSGRMVMMTGATDSQNGTAGALTAPTAGEQGYVFKGSGQWQPLSYVGMIIHSTTLDTEDKVKAFYGGTKWIQHSGYVLRGATSGVIANSKVKTGGSDNAVVPYHNHTFTGSSNSFKTGRNTNTHTHSVNIRQSGDEASGYGLTKSESFQNRVMLSSAETPLSTKSESGTHYHDVTVTPHGSISYAGTSGNATNANIPNYKSVYIWERTA